MTPADCQHLDTWARRLFAPSLPPVRIVSDDTREPGSPLRDLGRRELRLHPEDYATLHRWATAREA